MTGTGRRWVFADQLGPHFLRVGVRRPIQDLHRLADLDALVEQERARGSRAP
jgi:deoxyribodipyrimidine photolyase-related protein